MKQTLCVICIITICLRLSAQSQEMEQLRLDMEKLAQFKLMLSEMKSGYQSLVNGCNSVRDAGKANFDLHQQYLNGLLQVTPEVKNSPLVQRIYGNQQEFVTSYKALVSRLRNSRVFTPNELTAIAQEIGSIGQVINADVELLVSVLTPGRLRMSDAERSAVITRVDQSVKKQVGKLQALNEQYNRVMILRLQQKRDVNAIKQLGNLH